MLNINYDNSSNGFVATNTTATYTHINSTDPYRYMVFLTDNSDVSVSYAGVSASVLFTYLPTTPPGTNCPRIRVLYIANPASGSNTVSITNTSLVNTYYVSALSFTGADENQADAFNSEDSNNTQQVSWAGEVNSTVDNTWIVTFLKHSNASSRTWSAGAGTVVRQSVAGSDSAIADIGAVATTAGNYNTNLNISSSSAFVTSITASFKSKTIPNTGGFTYLLEK